MSENEPAGCGLQKDRLIVVAVSGGADSMALLHFLHSKGYPLLVATFNHRLRPEAASEVAYVRRAAHRLGLKFFSGSADVAAHAAARGLSLEEAAREQRYRFLFETARAAGAQAVATGHTADDQAETVLMHFLRGAGLAGLKGMPERVILPVFDEHIPLVRPLLGWSRAETETYCRKLHLAPRSDQSNADTQYFRNRLRHELLPLLQEYNPLIRSSLAKTALALQGDYELVREAVDAAWRQALRQSGEGYLGFDLGVLHGMSPALRRNLFRRAALQLCPAERDIDFAALERAASLRAVDLAGGLRTLPDQNTLYLYLPAKTRLPSPDWPLIEKEFSLRAGEDLDLGNDWRVICETYTGNDAYAKARCNTDIFTAWLAVNGQPIRLRPPLPGDRFEPLGMPRQTMKLADLFVNLKIAHHLRGRWPLVCVGEEIAWVTGLRLAEPFKVRPESLECVLIRMVKSKGQV